MINFTYKKLLVICFAIGICVLSFFVIKPILTSILLAFVLAYMFYPLYLLLCQKMFWRKKQHTKLAAWIIILMIILIILIPILLLVSLLFFNLQNISNLFNALGDKIYVLSDNITNLIGKTGIDDKSIDMGIKNTIGWALGFIKNLIQAVSLQIPQFLLGFFITLFVTYYLLLDAKNIIPKIRQILPIKAEKFDRILHKFNGLIRGLFYSQFIIASIQTVLMAIACMILGLQHVILLSLLTFGLAIIPFLGAIIVWIGITLHLIFGVPDLVLWKPIFMAIYGTLLISTVDNFVRPLVLSNRAKMNPAIMLVGLIGGISLFGIPGIFIGPLILIMMEYAIEILIELSNKEQ